MLRFLRIRNLAVIESVDVEFEPGFNVLTGETGAGKSIVVEAVGLLLGARASADLVRTGETQASIEAIFEEAGAAGAEPHELVIRRDISSNGRSRSFINGALATAAPSRSVAAPRRAARAARTPGAPRPTTHLPLLDLYAGLERDALRSPPRGTTCADCASSSTDRGWTHGRRARAST
jgi:DNA repair protein RecN (Recombination protein N)